METLAATDQFTPIYYRIQESIRRRIVGGEFRAGDRLPSETELARDFRTTRVTVRHALSRLVYDGLILRQTGRGTFVADRSSIVSRIDTLQCHSFEQQVALRGKVVSYGAVSFKLVEAPSDVAVRLSMAEGQKVYRLDRQRKIDDHVVGVEIRYIPMIYGERVTQRMLERESAHDFLSEVAADPLPVIEVTMTAITAPKWLAGRLQVKPGSALMVRDNVFRDAKGRIVQCGKSYFPGDLQMEYVLGKSPGNIAGD